MMASVISNLCHTGMARLLGAFHQGSSFCVFPSQTDEDAWTSRVFAFDPRSALTRQDVTGRAPHHAVSITGSRPMSRASWRSRTNTRSPASALKPLSQRSAEHARAVEHTGRDEFAQPGRELLVNEADMAEEDGERDEGAAGVIDCDEGGVSDNVERLLATIVGMCPPADVGEKARHVAQPPLFRGLVEPGGRHEAVGPGDQLLAVGG